MAETKRERERERERRRGINCESPRTNHPGIPGVIFRRAVYSELSRSVVRRLLCSSTALESCARGNRLILRNFDVRPAKFNSIRRTNTVLHRVVSKTTCPDDTWKLPSVHRDYLIAFEIRFQSGTSGIQFAATRVQICGITISEIGENSHLKKEIKAELAERQGISVGKRGARTTKGALFKTKTKWFQRALRMSKRTRVEKKLVPTCVAVWIRVFQNGNESRWARCISNSRSSTYRRVEQDWRGVHSCAVYGSLLPLAPWRFNSRLEHLVITDSSFSFLPSSSLLVSSFAVNALLTNGGSDLLFKFLSLLWL